MYCLQMEWISTDSYRFNSVLEIITSFLESFCGNEHVLVLYTKSLNGCDLKMLIKTFNSGRNRKISRLGIPEAFHRNSNASHLKVVSRRFTGHMTCHMTVFWKLNILLLIETKSVNKRLFRWRPHISGLLRLESECPPFRRTIL